MKTLRTPDERFADLPDYDFAPHYAEVDDLDGGTLRMHYLDEGPRDAPVILLMHGEPSWCFLYRTMIPVLVAQGLRCVAPDLVGFGRSDKPTERTDYTYARHVEWVRSLLLDVLDLRDITFFGQDWGGLVGLRVVAENPSHFTRVVIGNTGLPDGSRPASKAFLDWQEFSQSTPTFDVGSIVSLGVSNPMPEPVRRAYDAPFPDDSYKAGARVFPTLVPTSTSDPAAEANRRALDVLSTWEKPFLTLFSDADPVTAGGEGWFQRHVPGAQGQPHETVSGAGHFLQEDAGPDVAKRIAAFVAST